MGKLLVFLENILVNRWLLLELVKKDLYQRYIGSFLGVWWAFIQPVITVMIFWFVFSVGLKVNPVDDVPFILWLMTGMFPWFFINDAVSGATTSILNNSYLVKKVMFRVSLMPVVKVISALIIHIVFIIALVLIFIFYGYTFSLHLIEVTYYLFASLLLAIGLSWINSAVVIFFKDLQVIVNMLLQIFFWVTPIFWSLKLVPEQYVWILKLNPFYYIIEGYRNAFIYKKWFWEMPFESVYYWCITAIIFMLGILIFKKLRPHFADVI